MRLGELLLQYRLVTPAQLDAALEEQRTFGKRLGTNVVQMGFVDVDTLSRALGQQRGIPSTLRKHVAAIDKRVVAQFPRGAVTAYQAVPVGYTMTTPKRIVVACADPAIVPVEELSFALGSRVDLWVAPELLVQYCLEHYFGVPKAKARFIEVDFGPSSSPMSSNRPVALEQPIDRISSLPGSMRGAAVPMSSNPPAPRSVGPSSRAAQRALTPPAAMKAVASPPRGGPSLGLLTPPPFPVAEAPVSEPSPSAVRRPPMLDTAAADHARESFLDDLPPDSGWDDVEPARALPVEPEDEAVPSGPISAPPDMLHPVIDTAEAGRLLEMATTKERVGAVLADWLRSTFGCGLVLIVKGELAVGWQGYFRDAEDLLEAVAIPLNKPSMFSPVVETRLPFCGSPKDDGAKTNALFWKLLRCPPPSEVVICPVVLSKRAVNLLYAHAEDDSPLTDTQFREAQVVAGNAGAAYLRIIQRERAK
jgi:hypothetical protein